MNTNILIVVVVGYLIGMPILLRLLCHMQKKLRVDKKAEKAGKSKEAMKNIPKPIWPKIKEQLRFTFKDKRPAQLGKKTLGVENRILFFILYGGGAAFFIGGGAIGMFTLLPVGILLFFIAVIFSYKSSQKLLETREKIIRRMFDIGRAALNLSAEYEPNPNAVVKVLEWDDYIKPKKAEYQIPTNFRQESAEGFMKLFNQNFGGETAWVPSDDPETHEPGWNYAEGILTIHAVPPLPQKAPWNEHYVLNDKIAWSFFPIGLGVENGVELPNSETGETEYVLGFDLSGEQSKIKGVKKSGTIVTSPMVFIGGGTGGGKALYKETPVKIIGQNRI